MENGGRIFLPNRRPKTAKTPTAAPIVEDLEWRKQHHVAAPIVLESVAPQETRWWQLKYFFNFHTYY